MKNFIYLIGILIFSATGASAQALKLSISSGSAGKIIVSEGRLRSTIDLSEEVTGCTYAGSKIRKGCAASPAVFRLIDYTEKDKKTYLLILSTAQDNCNVCKRCGASRGLGLIWVELDAKLRAEKENHFPLQDCMAFREILNLGDAGPDLSFAGDVLKIDTRRKNIFEKVYEISHIEYDRRTPEKGLIIKTDEPKPLEEIKN